MKPREHYIHHIKKNLIGPGADVFGLNQDEELLSHYPLQMYYSGIIYPERKNAKLFGEQESSNDNADFDDSDFFDSEEGIHDATKNGFDLKDNSKKTESSKDKGYTQANSYFPSNCGLSFCIPSNVQEINVDFSAGIYIQVSDIKSRIVAIEKQAFYDLINEDNFPFKDNLSIKEKDELHFWMSLSKPIAKDIRATKSEIYKYIKKLRELGVSSESVGIRKLDLLTSGVVFKRKNLKERKVIDLENDRKIDVFKNGKGNVIARCHVKVVKENDRTYVKLLLDNTNEKHPPNKFSLSNELLNEKSLFQVEISVQSELESYKSRLRDNAFDEEENRINFQYRNLKSYGIGHGCAVQWDTKTPPNSITTTFLPQVEVRDVSNDFRKEDSDLKEIANLRNLSIWTNWSNSELCQKLDVFVDRYEKWINQQETEIINLHEFRTTATSLVNEQRVNSERLRRNIEILRTNKDVYDVFLLANTAMYIQLIISIDKRFGNKEKELYEIYDSLNEDSGFDLKSLSFFENYQPERPIAYRPFQLAFLLLNLESMIEEEATDRNIVDLIWFPTGGGKTEAYLALSAFTIIWRRLINGSVSKGVSVIMRYTLRLLTAQQFERASRLILALEFLNRKSDQIPTQALNRTNIDFGGSDKPITIGMWVGMATSPNTLEEANYQLNSSKEGSLENKISRLNNSKSIPLTADGIENVFQVSACPWCGCKTITRRSKNTEDKFSHSFYVSSDSFTVECLNEKCEFSNSLPIDVVDESLYNKPPTLLFATVDKFAQLSHREEGHVFFNSLDKVNLPPDLIIQDELHLLNGPLGSIVGLFEAMVEMLSTKGKRKPKIIASTATTRNTEKQVANLYGGRAVNIFPPSGISYDDNYFSFTRSSETGQRLHVGFMPTGKTQVDTQVRAVIPNLLLARILLFKHLNKNDSQISDYWTIVSYYNSLKDIGKIYNKVNDEIKSELKRLHAKFELDKLQYDFNFFDLIDRTKELTSRIESHKIKSYLNELSTPLKTKINEKGYRTTVGSVADLVLSSNMFSVGIDVSRLNVMLMNGQPKNIAEYIQASSRVARKNEGLVINLLDANRAREKSYFENFVSFHNAYYKFVEPLTVTPYTEIAFDKVLNTILVCFVRHKKHLNKNDDAHLFEGHIEELINYLEDRIDSPELFEKAKNIINVLSEKWSTKVYECEIDETTLSYKNDLISKPQSFEDFSLMNSMREVDTNSLIEINIP